MGIAMAVMTFGVVQLKGLYPISLSSLMIKY